MAQDAWLTLLAEVRLESYLAGDTWLVAGKYRRCKGRRRLHALSRGILGELLQFHSAGLVQDVHKRSARQRLVTDFRFWREEKFGRETRGQVLQGRELR